MKVYRSGSKLIRPTGESPRQFEGILLAVYQGDTPETVEESVIPVEQLRGLQEVEVSTLGTQWRKALRLPEVGKGPNQADTPTLEDPSIRGESVTPATNPIEVIETHYVSVNPRFGWFCLNFFLLMGILTTITSGINIATLVIVILMSFVSVAYAWAASYLQGTCTHHRA